jgi:hypothetical protein
MTRSEFMDNINDFDDLISFCDEMGCYACEDVIDHHDLDSVVCEDIKEATEHVEWTDIRDALDDIDAHCDWYERTGDLEFRGLEDEEDFITYKNDVADWMDDNDLWDSESNEEDEDADEEDDDLTPPLASQPPEEPPVQQEDFPVSVLMDACSAELRTIQDVVKQQAKDSEQAIIGLLAVG